MDNQPVQEPNFEGEEMKLPGGGIATAPVTQSKSFSLVLAGLFLLLVVLLGGLFFWYRFMQPAPVVVVPEPAMRPTPEMNREPESTTAAAQADALEVMSTSNELDAIEADIMSTNLDALDSELVAIDAEIEAAATQPTAE